jgi:hypothetical protein
MIKEFLVAEKEAGRLLTDAEELYRSFCLTHPDLVKDVDLPAKFETCIGRLENRGLIRRLSFGRYVLLQPEKLDAYASAMVNAAKSEPDGLGCIVEEDALAGRFAMPADERVASREQEKLLLIATVEDLLRHEIVLKETGDGATDLVFPSQFTRERPDAPDVPGKAVVFGFEGPLLNIYATLAVRLAHSRLFVKGEMWKNAASYRASVGGMCGIYLREVDEGRGELILFFDGEASEATRYQFEDYIAAHLQRRALPETVVRRRIFVCAECAEPIAESAAQKRRERGLATIRCNVCDFEILLLDGEARLATSNVVAEMDRAADAKRDRDAAAMTLRGKIASNDYDVFLCHNSKDKPEVKVVGERLKEYGILPWLDEWELRPGVPWQRELEKQIENIKAAAVFVGTDGFGPWQDLEQQALLNEFANRVCPIIPVILPGCVNVPKLPAFLRLMTWVDFRKLEPEPLRQLIWGITGQRERV